MTSSSSADVIVGSTADRHDDVITSPTELAAAWRRIEDIAFRSEATASSRDVITLTTVASDNDSDVTASSPLTAGLTCDNDVITRQQLFPVGHYSDIIATGNGDVTRMMLPPPGEDVETYCGGSVDRQRCTDTFSSHRHHPHHYVASYQQQQQQQQRRLLLPASPQVGFSSSTSDADVKHHLQFVQYSHAELVAGYELPSAPSADTLLTAAGQSC